MLTIVTGTPGAGKTLFAIADALALSERTGRPVYYHNIKGVTHPDWTEFTDPHKWMDCPQGSIILMDETWEYFESNAQNPRAPVPDSLKPLATHRHEAHDVYLVTQHSTQVHTFVRKMAGRHVHLLRRFGMHMSTKFEWPESANERDGMERQRADRTQWKFPKKLYGTYSSTVLDTVERRLPWKRYAALAAAFALVPALLFYAMSVFEDDDESDLDDFDAMLVHQTRPFNSGWSQTVAIREDLYDPENWIPEVKGIPYSAQFYDQLIQPVDYPRITGCGRHSWSSGEDECWCTDQQGNFVDVPYHQCLRHVKHGVFDFSQEYEPPVMPSYSAGSAAADSGIGGAAAGRAPLSSAGDR